MQLHAQMFSVEGSVNDIQNGQPLPGATIQLDKTSQYAVTDQSGKFVFAQVTPGTHTLTVKYVGFKTKSEEINVSENMSISIALEESVEMTDEVIVYATRATEKTPTTYTNVNQEAIEKQNFGQDLPFLLNWTPSLVTTSDAGAGIGYTGLRIRGSDATRINVTINGVPYNDSESQGTFWVNISDIASSSQSIQVQRGVGTSTNGAGAFGASVNLQTSSLNADPYAEVTAGAGSFNSQRYVLKAGTGLINDHWSFDGRVSKITSDGYIKRATSDLGSYFLSGAYYGKNTIVKALKFGGHEETYQAWNGVDEETIKSDRRFNWSGAIFNEDGSIRYYDNEVDHYNQNHYQLHVSQKLSTHWTANVSLHYTYGRGYYEQYKQDEAFADLGLADLIVDETTISSGDFVTRKWLDNHFYGTTYSLQYENARTSFILGGGYNEYANAKHFGEIIWAQYASNATLREKFYDGEADKKDFNVYAKLNYEILPSLNAFADVQYRNVNYETAGIDDNQAEYDVRDNFNFFNPKAGLSYTLSANNVLYGSYAVAHREPNRTDYLDGEEKPRAERLDNVEIGWRRNTSAYSLEVNYYLMNYTDQLVLTGALNNVGNPIRANVGKSYRTGIEVSGGIQFSKNWFWNVNATYSINKNKDYVLLDENNEPSKHETTIILSPDLIAGSQLSWTGIKNLQVSLMTKYVSEQYLDNTENESLMLDAYFINDLRLSYGLPLKGIRGIEASLLLNNIFDVDYITNGYSWGDTPYYYPQAGRNFMAMITFKF